ncbi:MAG: DUF1508 domain-containing protein [Bacteroidota bacterium]
MKFQMFQAGQGGQFNFQLVTENNDPVLVSADFANRDDCVNAIRTLIESLREEANYTKFDEGETFKFQISNGGQTLVESVGFESEEEVNEAIRSIQDDASANEEFNVEFISRRRRVVKAPPRDIDIATLYDFTLTSQSGQPGFERIKDENGNLYYFIYNDESGAPILFGRSFPTASRRDGRIRTVIKSGSKANKYEIITSEGNPYFIIKASNGQEIARSKPFGSVQEAQQIIDKMVLEVPTYAERFVKPSKPRKVNQYILTRPSSSGDVGFESFRNEDNKEYYFHLNDEDAKALLYSEGYSSSRGRNNGIKSVIRNGVIRDRYEIKEDEAQYYFILRAGNRQEIARSRNFSSKNEAENAILWLIGRFPVYATEYSVTLPQTETFTLDVERAAIAPEAETKSARDIDSYNLDRASTSGKTGFESFKNEEDGEHYFHYNDDGGNAMWYSEGYTAPRSRDNGIRSVIKNGVLKERYEIKEEDGQYYVVLRAGNRQEIARSRNFGSREEAEKSIIWFRSRLPGVAAEQGVELDKQDELTDEERAFAGLALISAKKDIDSYNFDRLSTSGQTGFESFKNEDDGEFYFHYNDDGGNAMWYSEGYTAPRSRDNGIRSVIKNGVLAERYEIKEEGGKYYIVLKAGNRQEIARSRNFGSREDAEKGIIWMRSRLPGVAAEQGVELDKQDELTDEERAFAGIPLLAAAGTIGKDIDTYDFSRASTSGEPGFETFQSDKNGEYYFHLNDENGEALFFSEGYTSASGRDNGVRSVIKNGGLSERYQLVEEGGKYYWVLKAGNRQEIARSRTFNSKGEANKFQGWYMAALPAYAASYGVDLGGGGGTVSAGDTAIYGFVDSDDYDISRWGSAGTPGYYSYQSEADGKYYFLLYGDDRNAAYYSPGYDSAAERDTAMQRFAAFSDAQGSYKLREQDGKYYYVLYGPSGEELGRSGFYENEDSAKGFLGGFLGALPLWAASAGLSTAEGDTKADAGAAGVVAGDAEVTTDTAEVETEAASVGAATGAASTADTGGTTRSYEEEEKSGRGFPAWLRWLLLLLLLLLLIWLLMRACGTGSGDVGINPGATENSSPSGVVVPVDTLEDSEEADADAELDAVGADSIDVDSTTYREAPVDLKPLGPDAAALGFVSGSMAGKIADFLSSPDGGDGGAMKFIMDNTRFGLNEAHLNPAGYPSVEALAKILEAYPDATLRIVGHIDGTEREAYDGKYQDGTGITLSEIRARCIYRRLIDKGVAAGRMSFEGRAASENTGDNDTAVGREENRRIELFISR